MDIKKLMGNMGILGLFVFGMMAFIVITQDDNSVNDGILDNEILNETYGDLASSLAESEAQTQSASDNFGKTPPTQEFGELEVKSIFSPTKTIKTITIGIWNIYIKLPQAVLGVSPIVASLISSILLVLLVIGTWAIWKGVVS